MGEEPRVRGTILYCRSFALVAAIAQAGCVAWEPAIKWEIASPSGERVAQLYRTGGNGGATDGFVYRLVVAENSRRPAPLNPEEEWIWRAYVIYPTYIFWLDEATIEVQITPEDLPRLYGVRARERNGVRAVVTVIEDRSKTGVLRARPVQVLEDERPR